MEKEKTLDDVSVKHFPKRTAFVQVAEKTKHHAETHLMDLWNVTKILTPAGKMNRKLTSRNGKRVANNKKRHRCNQYHPKNKQKKK